MTDNNNNNERTYCTLSLIQPKQSLASFAMLGGFSQGCSGLIRMRMMVAPAVEHRGAGLISMLRKPHPKMESTTKGSF